MSWPKVAMEKILRLLREIMLFRKVRADYSVLWVANGPSIGKWGKMLSILSHKKSNRKVIVILRHKLEAFLC